MSDSSNKTRNNRGKASRAKDTTKATWETEEQARAVIQPILDGYPALVRRFGYQYDVHFGERLGRHFTRMERGNKLDERTPFFKEWSRSAVIKRFTDLVKKDFAKVQAIQVPRYAEVWTEVEEGQAKNIGPQSEFLPFSKDGPSKVIAVMSDKPPKAGFNWKAWEQACEDTARLLPPHSLKSVPMDLVLNGLKGKPGLELDPKTNAGFPTLKRIWYSREMEPGENEALDQTMDIVLGDASELIRISRSEYRNDVDFVAVVGQRTVQKGANPYKEPLKGKRIIMMMPKHEAVAGKTVMWNTQPALAQARNPDGTRIIPAWSSMPTLDKNMQVFLKGAHDAGRAVLSGDISSFDATLPPWAMWTVAQACSRWFDRQTANLFLMIMHADVYNTSVLMPTGYVKAGPSSVKSGSIFTSLVGCMANYTIQRYGMHAGYYKIDRQCVMGDDFIIDGDGISPDSISAAFDDLGMSCHPDKQFMEPQQLHFLQRTHTLGYPGGQGSVYRILGNVMSVEDDTQLRYDERNRYAYAFQALARLENANFNPEFETLANYVAAHDEIHLGKNLPVEVIQRQAGDYAERRLSEAKIKPWQSVGTGVPFSHWAINRVLRGEKLPPPGEARFRAVYGIGYDQVAL